MLISSWNVNSVRARIENIKEYLKKFSPDILMMQEIKTPDETYPYDDIKNLKYENYVFGQKSYNGVAIISKNKGSFFRIAIKGGGCSGFQYDFSFDKNENDDDLKHENIIIDKNSADLLKGSEVDYVEELIGNSFKISNPQSKSSCGCGVSFSL